MSHCTESTSRRQGMLAQGAEPSIHLFQATLLPTATATIAEPFWQTPGTLATDTPCIIRTLIAGSLGPGSALLVILAATIAIIVIRRSVTLRQQRAGMRRGTSHDPESIPAGILLLDRQEKITVTNRESERLLGLSRQQLLGRSLGEAGIIGANIPGKPWNGESPCRRTIRSGEPLDGIVAEICDPNDQQRWVHLSTRPLTDAHGAITGVMLGLVDITPIVRAHNRAIVARTDAESNTANFQRLALVAERTTNAVIITDAQRRTVWANDGFTRITGYTSEEVVGKSPGAILQCASTSRETVERIRQALNAGTPFRGEILNRGKDGREYWLDLDIQPLHDESGELTGFLAVESDITDLVNQRDIIAEREQRFRTLVNNIPGVSYRRAHDDSWTVEFISEAIEELTGCPPQDLIDRKRSLTELIHPEDLPAALETINAAIAGREPYTIEYRILRPDGALRWVKETGRGIFEDATTATPLYLDGAMFDITQLKHARAEAEEASRAKTRFLANMSHEIRTPLTAIIGYAEILRDDLLNESGPSQRTEAINTIQRAGEHLLAVINDILDLSKIESGKTNIVHAPVQIAPLLLEVQKLMQARATAKGIALNVRIDTSIPASIESDATKLRQILMNLVGNAVKFTAHGSVTIIARAARQDAGETLSFDIEDTGPGLTPEQAKPLFTPFFQADPSDKRRHGGTGLGLSVSRRLARLMQGDVWLERTEPGKGSCFSFTIPVATSNTAERIGPIDQLDDSMIDHNEATNSTPDLARESLNARILLAEDGPDNQRLIAFHLERCGATVEIANNGRIALNMINDAADSEKNYDLLLTDIQMPEMDGYELARTLRARGNDIPILAITAHAMDDDEKRCLDAGCNDYTSKPINQPELIAKCRNLLQRHATQTAKAA